MMENLKGGLIIASILLTPALLVWAFGAFFVWDAGWFIETTEMRVLFVCLWGGALFLGVGVLAG